MSLTRLLCLSLVVVAMASANPWTPAARTEKLWKYHHEALLENTQKYGSKIKAIFLGDDYTQGWGIISTGQPIEEKYYAPRHVHNYGVDGDKTENVLWRIENGELDKLTPKVVVVMVGYNNLKTVELSADIAKGVETIVQKLQEKLPKTKILLLSVLPVNSVLLDGKIHLVNHQISKISDSKVVFYHDLTAAFETSTGNQKAGVWEPDHFHLSKQGYQTWYEQMEPIFSKLYNGELINERR